MTLACLLFYGETKKEVEAPTTIGDAQGRQGHDADQNSLDAHLTFRKSGLYLMVSGQDRRDQQKWRHNAKFTR